MNPAVNFLASSRSGKIYTPTPIQIGDQIWDQKNLDALYYRDGSLIQYAYTSPTATVGAWFWYDGLQSNGYIYGRLYNWWAVNDSRNIAPVGWRVATTADWDTLTTYLGGASVAGNKLKQSGTTLWQSPNGGTNTSGFTALPGGLLNIIIQEFENINQFAYFRTSNSADIKRLQYNSAALQTAIANDFSFHSVRLIKIQVELATNAASPTVGATATSLSTGGTISNLNNFTLTSWGVCYNTSPNPTTSNNTAAGDGTGSVGSFNSTMTGLNANTSYYIRAYVVTTSLETFYGQQVIGITTGTSTITTSAISLIGSASATGGGTITSSNFNPIAQSGICWAVYPATPTIADGKTTDGYFGTAVVPPTTQSCGLGKMTGLLQSTQYNVRAYVTTTDTTYGNQVTFSTIAGDTLRAAYSLRNAVSSYSLPPIRVRGVISGSTIIADVSFNSSGWVDTNSPITIISGTYSGGLTLGAFATLASTVWVQTWYDQSGNAKNVNQTITSRQPTIAVLGALNRAGVNNKVALKFTRNNFSWMVSATDTSLDLDNTQVYTVCNSDSHTATGYGQVAVSLNATNRYYSGVFGVGTGSPSTGAEWIGYGSASATYASALLLTPAITASQLFYSVSNATGISSWLNDTFKGTYSATNTANSTSINIGATGTGSTVHFNGSIQEVQIYTPVGTTNRQEVSGDIRGYYGIPTTPV
jgi:uncharacterized protein (TIGR02145 family)